MVGGMACAAGPDYQGLQYPDHQVRALAVHPEASPGQSYRLLWVAVLVPISYPHPLISVFTQALSLMAVLLEQPLPTWPLLGPHIVILAAVTF